MAQWCAQVLCNGPGTCLPVCLITLWLRAAGLGSFARHSDARCSPRGAAFLAPTLTKRCARVCAREFIRVITIAESLRSAQARGRSSSSRAFAAYAAPYRTQQPCAPPRIYECAHRWPRFAAADGLRAVRSSLGRADTVRMLWRRQVKSLSLTGKILYHLRITDHFLVQWAQLSTLFPRAAFRQLLC